MFTKEQARLYRINHPDKTKRDAKRYRLKNRYGLTVEEFETKRLNQQNKCAICRADFVRTPFVDHNHETKIVRDLLCNSCNCILGHAHDNILILMLAIDYLKKHQEKQDEITKRVV